MLYGNTEKPTRTDLILELDPCYKQAAYITNDYKLIVGDPSPRPYDEVFRPLKNENDTTYYEDDDAMYSTYSNYLYGNQSSFIKKMADSSSKTFYKNISEVGPFTTDNIMLFDLSSDPSESYDLFTESSRFESMARKMYSVLAENAAKMGKPLFFVDEFKLSAEDIADGVGIKTYQFKEGEVEYKDTSETTLLKWTPWLDDEE